MTRTLGPRRRHGSDEAARTLATIAHDLNDASERLWELHRDSWPSLSDAQRGQLKDLLLRVDMIRPTANSLAILAQKRLEDTRS